MAPKIWVCDDEPSARFPVYTRANAGEVFAEVASPLTWTTYDRKAWEPGHRDALYEMGVFTPDEFKPAGQCELSGCFGGYVYLNASVTRVIGARVPGLTVEAIDAAFFGHYPDAPPYRPDPRDRNAARSAAVSVWMKSLYTADPKALTDQDALPAQAALPKRHDYAGLSDATLLEQFRSLKGVSRILVKRHMLNTYGCNVLTGIIAQSCQAAGAGQLASKITVAGGDVDSARQSFELWDLSRMVRTSPVLLASFEQGVDGVLDRLLGSSEPVAKEFLARWNDFLEHWGFEGPSAWELRSPTYRTNPEIPLRMLDSARHAPDTAAPSIRSAASADEREAAVAEVARRLAGNAEMQAGFFAAARSAPSYLAARERSKTYCARVMEAGRAPLRELGQRLVKLGQLPRWQDLLLVTDEEADAFVANPTSYASLIAERGALLELLMTKEPPFVFEGDAPPLSAYKDRDGKMQAAAAGTRLQGIGVSSGRHTGRARVITSLDVENDLAPGDVIVAATTDASWGPLFLAAGAVVVETGATVSHAAIVSRELGIPAAVSVTDATRCIRDGVMITVDGDTGTVTVH